MNSHVKKLEDEREKLKFAEALDVMAQHPDAGFQEAKRQFREQYGTDYIMVLREKERGR